MELTDVALDYRISNSLRSAEDLARAVIRAATRGDFYFFPPGEDLRLWWLILVRERLFEPVFLKCQISSYSGFLHCLDV